jgi:hypothetical protein
MRAAGGSNKFRRVKFSLHYPENSMPTGLLSEQVSPDSLLPGN